MLAMATSTRTSPRSDPTRRDAIATSAPATTAGTTTISPLASLVSSSLNFRIMWVGACRQRDVLAFPPRTDDIEDAIPVATFVTAG